MPRYLKQNVIRRLEASIHSLHLAIKGLSAPRMHKIRDERSTYAAEMGLIGASVELAMSAVVVQIFSKKQLMLGNNSWKTASEILDDFKSLLKSPPAKLSIFTRGIEEPEEYAKSLLDVASKFNVLFKWRGTALHAGRAPDVGVCIATAEDAAVFLNLLAKSDRASPYLQHIPAPPRPSVSRHVLVDEIKQRLSKGASIEERRDALASLFLVLPEVPEEEPEWIEVFDKVEVAPEEKDIVYLTNILERAKPVSLAKVNQGEGLLATRIDSENSEGTSIGLHLLKTKFTKIPDLWHTAKATANGSRDMGSLHLPDSNLVCEVFKLGLEKADVLPSAQQKFTAHEAWPFVASSLSVQGTAGPYWYIVRKTSDLGQLNQQLKMAVEIGNGYLKRKSGEMLMGSESIRKSDFLPEGSALEEEMVAEFEKRVRNKKELSDDVKRQKGKERGLEEEQAVLMNEIAKNQRAVGDFLIKVGEAQAGLDRVAARYWAGKLCAASSDEEDLPALLAVLQSENLDNAHAAARKAIRLIDCLNHGPRMNSLKDASV